MAPPCKRADIGMKSFSLVRELQLCGHSLFKGTPRNTFFIRS